MGYKTWWNNLKNLCQQVNDTNIEACLLAGGWQARVRSCKEEVSKQMQTFPTCQHQVVIEDCHAGLAS